MSRTLRAWRIRRWFRQRGRFALALLATVLVVAYVIVPWVVELLQTIGGYNPSYYEPKDAQREEYLRSLPPGAAGLFTWATALKLLLIVLVCLAWLSVLTSSPSRGRR